MKRSGVLLRIYVQESQRHSGLPLYEWVLAEAQRLGFPGGSAFRAIAGFGRHGVLREQTFFELAGQQSIEIHFISDETMVDRLLARLEEEKITLVYARTPIEYGVTGDGGMSGT